MQRRARIMRAVNVPMRPILRLPFVTPLSRYLMLLSLTRRTSGKRYEQPVSYTSDGDVLLTPAGGRWKLNLPDGVPISVRLRGRTVRLRPEFVREIDEVERLVVRMIAKNPRAAGFMPFVGPTGEIDRDRVQAALAYGFAVIRWRFEADDAATRAGVDGGKASASPVRVDRWLGLGGLVGAVQFVLVFTVAGLLRPGYSPVDQAVSDLGIGDNAWLLNGSLIVLGLSLVGLAISLFRTVRPPASAGLRFASAALLVGVGVGFAAAGIFDENNGLHWMLGAPLAYGGAILGLFLAGILLRRVPSWRAWGNWTLLACLAAVVLIALTFYAFSSYTFTPGDPSGHGQWGGLLERLAFIEILAWYAATGWRIFRGAESSA
jgi:hypothetical membrane protein